MENNAKLPRVEDYLTKLNAMINEIKGNVKFLSENKADKEQLQESFRKILDFAKDIDELNKLIQLKGNNGVGASNELL